MPNSNEFDKIRTMLQKHEQRIAALEGKTTARITQETEVWYKPGTTIGKVMALREAGFFDAPRSMKEIISELETRDYVFKSSDLTFPLRKIVRKDFLRKTKDKDDNSRSNNWLFVKE